MTMATNGVMSSITGIITKSASPHEQGEISMSKAKKCAMIPPHEIKTLAKTLYPTLKEYLDSPQGQVEFKKWQEQQKEMDKEI